MFSSLLRPLARASDATPDPVGSLQFLRNGYTFGGRSPFSGIHRLQPGQSLIFESGKTRIHEASRLWAEPSEAVWTPSKVAEEVVPLLRRTIGNSIRNTDRPALMVSGGWDSRTLLALIADEFPSAEPLAYSHGDVNSRELGIARKICHAAGLQHHAEEINASTFELDWIEGEFPKVECLIFPHWIRAGQVLTGLGARQIMSGVYGEVLGGHYGEAMIQHGGAKLPALVRSLMGSEESPRTDSVDWGRLEELFTVKSLSCPWYLRADYFRDEVKLHEEYNEDIRQDLRRLRNRGLQTTTRVVEAFVSEHRGSQYINAQPLSSRGFLPLSLPFADQELLRFLTSTPLSVRLHNRVNREIIRRMDPKLLQYPMGATLVPASTPFLLQEATRALRKIYDTLRWEVHQRSQGRVAQAHLSWSNFEFLRSGRLLNEMVDGLEGVQWDRRAMRKVLSGLPNWEWKSRVQPLANQLGKIHTVDLLMR